MTRLLPLALIFLIAVPAAATSVAWVTSDAPGGGDLRKGSFVIGDAQCGYDSMVDPVAMVEILDHLESVQVHEADGWHQDLTLSERFFLVGLVESRYDRQMNGRDRLEWQLTEGRQKRHDGFWQVTPMEGGGATITFENLIEAKSRLHQPLLRRIQNRTMDDIADAIRERCR